MKTQQNLPRFLCLSNSVEFPMFINVERILSLEVIPDSTSDGPRIGLEATFDNGTVTVLPVGFATNSEALVYAENLISQLNGNMEVRS